MDQVHWKINSWRTFRKKYNALLFHTDHYFLPQVRKTEKRLSKTGGKVDYEKLIFEIIDSINNDYIKSNYINCKTDKLEQRDSTKNKQVIIIEGAYSMHKKLLLHYTLTIFLEIEDSLQRDRILARNGEIMLERWLTE